MTKSYLAKPGEAKNNNWLVMDADNQVVGRLAARVATILMGKHKPTYTPHVDCGDYVVIINTDKIRFGGRRMSHPTHPNFTSKMLSKTYDKYTGYPGGRKIIPAAELLERKSEELIRLAVKRMLPRSKMGRAMLKKLKLYRGAQHPHQAQVPAPATV